MRAMAPGRMNMSCAMLPSTFCLLLLAGPASAAFHSSSMVTLADGNPSRIDEVEEDVAILAANDDGSLTTDTVSLLSLAQPEPSDNCRGSKAQGHQHTSRGKGIAARA